MEKKGYTLVSCLGRPKKGMTADSSYVITKYRFDDGSIIDKSIAASALIDYYRKEIKKAIIVGTKTSSWDALFPEECINDLWDKVEKESKVGISNETLKELEKELSRIFGFEFALIALPTELDAKNIKEINEAYSTINDKILKHTKLMIDITNGFRYIPMMLFQILQLRSAEYNIGEVKMFYGELQETPSQMRDVSSLWISAEINKQLYAFESAFDGDRLAETLIKSGGCGASIGNWIKGFTRIIKSNYVYDIQNQISLLRDCLDKNKNQSNILTVSGVDTTSIYKQTVKLLEDLKAQFDNLVYQYTSYYLLVFAQILYKRNLKIQALITLREALFTHFCEKYDKGKIGQSYTFEEMKKNKKYEQFDRKCKVNKISDQLYLLRLSRNESAHAGLSLNEGKKVNIDKYNFKEYVNAVKIAFEKCMDTPDE